MTLPENDGGPSEPSKLPGGSSEPTPATELGEMPVPIEQAGTTATRLTRRIEDTSAGCRDRAAASLVAAAAMDTVNGKSRMEASAATWTTRADLLHRLEQQQDARRATELSDGEEAAAQRLADGTG